MTHLVLSTDKILDYHYGSGTGACDCYVTERWLDGSQGGIYGTDCQHSPTHTWDIAGSLTLTITSSLL